MWRSIYVSNYNGSIASYSRMKHDDRISKRYTIEAKHTANALLAFRPWKRNLRNPNKPIPRYRNKYRLCAGEICDRRLCDIQPTMRHLSRLCWPTTRSPDRKSLSPSSDVLEFYLLCSRVSTYRIKNPSDVTSGKIEKEREREGHRERDRKIGNRPGQIMDSRLWNR